MLCTGDNCLEPQKLPLSDCLVQFKRQFMRPHNPQLNWLLRIVRATKLSQHARRRRGDGAVRCVAGSAQVPHQLDQHSSNVGQQGDGHHGAWFYQAPDRASLCRVLGVQCEERKHAHVNNMRDSRVMAILVLHHGTRHQTQPRCAGHWGTVRGRVAMHAHAGTCMQRYPLVRNSLVGYRRSWEAMIAAPHGTQPTPPALHLLKST